MMLRDIRFAGKLPPVAVQFPSNGVCHQQPCPWHLKPDEVAFRGHAKRAVKDSLTVEGEASCTEQLSSGIIALL